MRQASAPWRFILLADWHAAEVLSQLWVTVVADGHLS
jgi:hypothetical protein